MYQNLLGSLISFNHPFFNFLYINKKLKSEKRPSTVIVFYILILHAPFISLCQEHEHHSDNGLHQKEPGYELVISGTAIRNPEAENTDPSTEIHFTYWASHYWAFGVGYSLIYEDDGRVGQEVTPLVSYKPWPLLTINTGPSFALPNSEQGLEVSAYFEGELNIFIGDNGFHMGPVLGTLLGNEFRYFGGIHIGYEF
ncbi:MAG: hypothetical protein AAF363_12465 [Bacteroidota bacterium]